MELTNKDKRTSLVDENEKVQKSLKNLKEYLYIELASIGYPKQNIKKAILRIFMLEDNSKNVDITLQDVDDKTYTKLLTTKNIAFLK